MNVYDDDFLMEQEMATDGKCRLFLIKYLLITGIIVALGIVLVTFTLGTFIGANGRGYTAGITVDTKTLSYLGLHIVSSLGIAYFIGPKMVNAMRKGHNEMYEGIKSLFICWTAPGILITLITTLQDPPFIFMVSYILIALIPAIIVGPLVGYQMKKKIKV